MSRALGQKRRRAESVAGVVTSVALNAVAVLIATRLLGAAGRGQMVALGLVATLVHVLLGAGLPGANVFFAARDPDSSGRLLANTLAWSATLPILAWMLMLAVPDSWIPGSRLGLTADEVRAAVLLSPLLLGFQQSAGVVQGVGRFDALLRGRAIQGVAVVVGTLAYPLVASPSPFGLFCVWIASYGVGAAAFAWAAGRGRRFAPDIGCLRRTLAYGIRAMWTQVWEFVNMRGDQIIVAGLADAAALGVYSIAVSISELLFHIPNAISMVVFSDTATGEIQDQHVAVAREARRLFVYTALGAGLLAIVTYLIVVPLVGLEGEGLALALGVMSIPVSALACARLLGAYVMGQGRPAVPSIAAAVSFAVTVAIDVVAVPRFGAVGAAVGASTGYLAAALVLVAVFARTDEGAPSAFPEPSPPASTGDVT